MSYQAIGVVLGLMGLGAALVLYPAVLIVQAKVTEIARLKGQIDELKKALARAVEQANVQVRGEQAIDAARDLPPLDELRVLLGPGSDPAPGQAAGDSGSRI